MNKIVNRFGLKDKASSYHRTFSEKLFTKVKILLNPNITIGENSIIKFSNEFKMTENAKVQIGDNCTLKENSYFLLTKPNPFLQLGNYVGIGRGCYIAIKDKLEIGDYTRLGPNVTILDQDHMFKKDDLIMNQHAKIEKVSIGKDAWIGANVTILKGINIGDGAIIGANAVVTNNIPPYEIWGGVPAKFLKNRG
jgi:acetyltransferase-like isoleucine patch superfamily enzyme